MSRNKNRAPTACLAITLSLATLRAQQAADPAESRLQRLDTNGDDFLSKETKTARKDPQRAKKRFARMDQNGDGQISKDEFPASKSEAAETPGEGGADE